MRNLVFSFLRVCPFALALLFITPLIWGQQAQPANIYDASLDQLMNIQVTSVSKKEQPISNVAAAIFVITQEDIRRSGATNIPDLLRMVPGLDVAQINASTWAISSRGFNAFFANKLLVLIDGRSVYNPAFSGVFWIAADVPLADLDRIEVIRGPGATVWGANAVNGVINIITKHSQATQGTLLEAGAGSQLTTQDLVQYGGSAGRAGTYRVFASYSDSGPNVNANGRAANDAWHTLHLGFRSDWTLSSRDSLTVEGDGLTNADANTYSGFYSLVPPYQAQLNLKNSADEGNVLGRWTRVFSSGSDIALQVYYTRFNAAYIGVQQKQNTVDFDFQHHVSAGERNDIVWGLGYRVSPGILLPGVALGFTPASHTNSLASGFVQDEIQVGRSFWLTLGSKLEHNEYTGSNVQPSLRGLWSPNKRHSVWAAVSRGLREPSREDVSLRANLVAFSPAYPQQQPLTMLVSTFGNPSIQAEALTAYESGYRYEPNRKVSLDIAAYYNQYRHLISAQPGQPFFEESPLPHLTIPQYFTNNVNGTTYGSEVSANVNVTKNWKISPGYSWLQTNLRYTSANAAGSPYFLQGDGPENQFQLRSYLTLPRRIDFDTSLYYVGPLQHDGIPSYTRLDTRVSKKLGEWFELSIVGQNLLSDRQLEFAGQAYFGVDSYAKRSVFARGSWRF